MKKEIGFLESATTNNVVSKKELAKKYISKKCKRYFIDAFTGMAQGLFVTLIAGTILCQIGKWIGNNDAGAFFTMIGNIAKTLMGAGIGVGIAYQLKASKLLIFATAIAGFAGAFSGAVIAGNFSSITLGLPGNPIGSYVVSLLAIEITSLIAGKTKLDIILVPICLMLVTMAGVYVAWPFVKFVELIGKGIEIATAATPFVMGIIISVSMGILLTLPTSSAAIWVSIAAGVTSDAMLLAGGAAVCGCAAHMVGFAVQSFRENKWGGLISQGIGTSMLQIPNLMKHPAILIPPIVASAIVGPLSTCVFKLYCNATGGGMGTSGLVGVFGVIDASSGVIPDWQIGLGIFLLMFLIPIVVCLFMSELLRKFKVIKFGDMMLD